jgi:hypothetical protein
MRKMIYCLSAVAIFLVLLHPVLATLGDVNHDGVVDMKDIRLIAKSFGATPGSPRWNPDCDLNADGFIDMKDIRLAARNFGK